jgi:protein SSD1
MSDPNSSAPPAASGESKQGNSGGSSNRGRRSAKSTGGPNTSGNGSRPHSRNANKKLQSQGQPTNTQSGASSARNTDGASSDGKGSTGRRGGAQSGRGGRGGRKQPSTSNQRPNNKDAASPAASPGEGESPALSNLQKAIADLKAMPNSGTQASSPGTTQPIPPTQSTLTPSAPPFHPTSFVAPTPEVPPRHRKAQSMGPTPQQQIQSYSGLGQYTPGLDSMNEDSEFQPTETVSPLAQFGRHQAMGSFTAPRFAALQGQGAQSPGEGTASSGRPQLAPSFQFGNKRRTNSVSIGPPISEEDAGFQFPQTPQTPQNTHKRTGSEIIAEQIAIQSQIEALQQQQQHLLAQQLATGQVRMKVILFDICSP